MFAVRIKWHFQRLRRVTSSWSWFPLRTPTQYRFSPLVLGSTSTTRTLQDKAVPWVWWPWSHHALSPSQCQGPKDGLTSCRYRLLGLSVVSPYLRLRLNLDMFFCHPSYSQFIFIRTKTNLKCPFLYSLISISGVFPMLFSILIYQICSEKESCSQEWHDIHSLAHSFIGLFISSFIHLFISSFIHLFICSFIHWFIHAIVHSFIHLLVYWFNYSLGHSFFISLFIQIHLFIHSFVHSCNCSFIVHLLVHWLIGSIVHPFICSFILSFICLFILQLFIHSFVHSVIRS